MVVDEKLMAEFVARVAKPLNGLALKQRLTVAETAKLDLIWPHVLREITRRQAWRPGFQHENAHSLLGELFGPSATRT